MKIAIQAADLDAKRIDGTRVYILNLLKNFGQIDKEDQFLIYHKKAFNPELTPPDFSNYKIIQKPFSWVWSQTRFAWEIWKDQPDILWMPMQALPFFRRKNLRTIVTIHDLAFKYFPQCFPRSDLRKLNFLTDHAIRNSTGIIAVSQSTKNDILKFYPEINQKKISVIYHGFDSDLFSKKIPRDELESFLTTNYNLQTQSYLLYVGALQPRKNLICLVSAFETLKSKYKDLKLVLVGEKAWLWKELLQKIETSPYKKDILLPGKVSFENLRYFYQGAAAFVFPSLYEGFGLPILEAQASQVPVVVSNVSSLPEIAAGSAILFDPNNSSELEQKIEELLGNDTKRKNLIEKGLENIQRFSWEECARESLAFIKK